MNPLLVHAVRTAVRTAVLLYSVHVYSAILEYISGSEAYNEQARYFSPQSFTNEERLETKGRGSR